MDAVQTNLSPRSHPGSNGMRNRSNKEKAGPDKLLGHNSLQHFQKQARLTNKNTPHTLLLRDFLFENLSDVG